jgi:hypothetical protein
MEDPKKTLKPFERLVDFIEHYESDTFSASGSDITHHEAELVAERLIMDLIENEIDGVQISADLFDIRPDPNDEDDEGEEE